MPATEEAAEESAQSQTVINRQVPTLLHTTYKGRRSIKYTHSLSVRTQTVRRVIGVSKATKKQSKKNNINRLQS